MLHTGKSAFTLVELLVVISIIALLMGILLPYLGQAREQSRRAACMANLHSIGKSIYIYANDNEDKLIPGDCSIAWDVWGLRNEQPEQQNRTYQQVNLGYLISSGILSVPNDNDHIFFCPSSRLPDNFRPYEHFADKWGLTEKEAPISYMFNNDLDGFSNYVQPGDKPVLAHDDKINYLLGDGSVHLFKRTRLEFSSARPELIQDISARIGVCFPNLMIHNWLEKDRIDVAQALEYLRNPGDWMDKESALSTARAILLAEVAKRSLVCDVVGAWSGEPDQSEQSPVGHG
jgi:prepilin-type N-terminal cleavage/methylation domain-containing protein